jgi:predicted RNA polymerase sigma factor
MIMLILSSLVLYFRWLLIFTGQYTPLTHAGKKQLSGNRSDDLSGASRDLAKCVPKEPEVKALVKLKSVQCSRFSYTVLPPSQINP